MSMQHVDGLHAKIVSDIVMGTYMPCTRMQALRRRVPARVVGHVLGNSLDRDIIKVVEAHLLRPTVAGQLPFSRVIGSCWHWPC